MKVIKILALIGILASTAQVYAQQETLITQFPSHMNPINPAFAGLDDETQVRATIRSQWTGIPEAPETQFFSFATGLGKNIGLGFSAFNDKSFIEKSSQLALDLSYKIKLAERTDLYFGLKASANFFRLNASGLEVYNVLQDPALVDINEFSPNVGAGLLLKHKKFLFSFAAPRMLKTERADEENGIVTVSSGRPHFYLTAAYEVSLNSSETILLRPSVLVRQVSGAPVSADFNTMVSFHTIFQVGAMYRTSKAYAAIASLTLSKQLTFGYAYEINTISEIAQAQNTNELFLAYKFK